MYTLTYEGGSLDVMSLTLKTCINPTKELTPGGVCAAFLQASVLTGDPLAAGTELTLFREGEQLGVFLAEKPVCRGGVWQIEAYDKVSLLEQELGQWLYELPDWPYSLQTLCDKILEKCGLLAANALPRHGDFSVNAFAAYGVTGRTLLQWICQVAGCFCRADAEGRMEFSWLQETDTVIAPTGERFYYMDGFSCENYEVQPIEKVQLQLESADIGAVYPDEEEAANALVITGNYLLTSLDAARLETVARGLYEHLRDFTYTPGKVQTLPCIRAGDVFQVLDEAGELHTLVAMSCTETDGVLTAESTGAYRRDAVSAVNEKRYEALTGRVMNLSADVQGLKAQNKDAGGSLAELSLQVEGIASAVSRVDAMENATRAQLTKVEQTAAGLTVQVEKLTRDGTGSVTTAAGYTFDDSGLRIAKTGQEMENLLDNTGMYVKRSGEEILTASAEGVLATDVTVRNYLVIGSHARFEDYGYNRTACFYLAGEDEI